MKYYKIYFCPNWETEECEPIMYAFTNDKEMMKEFRTTRKKSLFRILTKVTKNDQEFDTLKHQLHTLMLRRIPLRTRDKNSEKGWRKIEIVGTYREETELMKYVEDFIYLHESIFKLPIEVFKKEYRDALSVLRYDVVYDWALSQREIPFAIGSNPSETKKKKQNADIFYDELVLFYEKFGRTLKNPG